MVGTEEGARCNRPHEDGTLCIGDMYIGDVVGCSCHISPPCSACLDNPLICDVCEAEVEA